MHAMRPSATLCSLYGCRAMSATFHNVRSATALTTVSIWNISLPSSQVQGLLCFMHVQFLMAALLIYWCQKFKIWVWHNT